MAFGYLSSNSFWAFQILNSGSVACGKWNGLAWQSTGVTFDVLPPGTILQGAGLENDVSISYDGVSNVSCYVNGTIAASITGVPGLTGSNTGFIVYVDSSEHFPQVPLNALFKQY
jgi:hypothetical protein